LIRETIISIALFLSASQIGAGQAEALKQAGVHSQYGIDIIPDPQIVRVAGADFDMNSATVVSADPQLQDLSPVVSLQEGLAETLQLHISTSGSQPPSNVILLKLVPKVCCVKFRTAAPGERHTLWRFPDPGSPSKHRILRGSSMECRPSPAG